MENWKEYALNVINIMINNDPDDVNKAAYALADEGILSRTTINRITSKIQSLDSLSSDIIYWMYVAIFESLSNRGLKSPELVFPESIRNKASVFVEKTFRDSFPIIIKNVEKLSPKEEYSFVLPIQILNTLNKAGLFRVIKGMQREEETIGFRTFVKFNNSVALKIAKEIENGTFFSNSIRFHLIQNREMDYEYNEQKKELKINNGVIACIDGQHRLSGIEYALLNNPKIDMKFHVIFTVGSSVMAQSIITQEEKRQRIPTEHLKKIQVNRMSSIINDIAEDLNIEPYHIFKSYNSEDSEGILNRSEFASSFQKRFDPKQEESRMFYVQLKEKFKTFLFMLIDAHEEFFLNAVHKTYNVFSSPVGWEYIFRMFEFYYEGKDISDLIQDERWHQISERPFTLQHYRKIFNGLLREYGFVAKKVV